MAPKTIAIVGGGPAGLMAAERLAAAGHHVHVYDRKPSVGRKFLMAGRGGLNLTHSEDLQAFKGRYGDAETVLSGIIDDFTPQMLRDWAEGLGQATFVGSSGRVFPQAFKASPLLRAWLLRLEQSGVEFHLHHEWKGWSESGDLLFQMPDGQTQSASANATLLAMGGASWPGLGSDGGWVPVLKQKQISISPLRPANCGFTCVWSDVFREKCAGQPLKTIALHHRHKKVEGEIMVAARGVEGGAIYALSSFLRAAIESEGYADIHIDLRPSMDLSDLEKKLDGGRGRVSFSTYLQKKLSLSPVAIMLLREVDRTVQDYPPQKLAALIKSLPLRLDAPFPIDRAISSAGGITLSNLNDDLMLNAVPGVFAAGEMLDWEAPTGGYLLQASFATGNRAAHGILRWLQA